MKPSDLLLSLLPTTSGLVELAHWLDAEGATSQLSVFISYTSAVGAAEAIVDAIHSEAATTILVDRLCVLRPHRADEIRRDLTFAAIKQERGAEAEALVEQMHDCLRANSALVDCHNALIAIEERGKLTSDQAEALGEVRRAIHQALPMFVWTT